MEPSEDLYIQFTKIFPLLKNENVKNFAKISTTHTNNLIQTLINSNDDNNLNHSTQNPKSMISQPIFPPEFKYELIIPFLSKNVYFSEFSNFFYFFLSDNFKKIKEAPSNKPRMIKKYIDEIRVLLQKIKCSNNINLFQSFTNYIQNLFKNQLPCNPSKESKENDNYEGFIEDLAISVMIYQKISIIKEDYSSYDLEQFNINSENIIPAIIHLTCNDFVKKLNLSSNKIGKEGIWAIIQILKSSKSLKDLDISLTFLDEDILNYLNGILEKEPDLTFNVEKLNISYNCFSKGNCAEYVSNFVSRFKKLKRFNISKSNIGEGMILILEVLERIRNFRTFIATCSKIDKYSLKYLSKMLVNERNSIQEVVLTNNDLNNYGGKALIDCLLKSQVVELIVANCEITNEICKDLPIILRTNKYCQSLNLSGNKIESLSLMKEITASLKYESVSEEEKIRRNIGEIFESSIKENLNEYEKNLFNLKSQNILKNLDISKQKLNHTDYFDDEFLDLMKGLKIKMFDISNNIVYNPKNKSKQEIAQREICYVNSYVNTELDKIMNKDKEVNILF